MDTKELLTILIAVFGCTGFWSFVQWFAASRRKVRTASEEALLAILHDMIYPMLEHIVLRPGENVGYEEMDRVRRLYEPYQKLGGNGTVEARYRIAEGYHRVPDEVIIHELEIKA